MKKTKLLFLATLLVSGSLVSCGSGTKEPTPSSDSKDSSTTSGDSSTTSTEISFGLGYSTSFENSNGTWTFEATVVTAAFDKDGKVLAARTDVTQVKFDVKDDTSDSSKYVVTAKAGSGDKSKLELGADYNMLGFSAIGKEMYEQIENWSAYTVGKTVSQVTDATDISGVSVTTDAFNAALKNAESKKYTVKVSSTTGLKAGVGMVSSGVYNGEGSVYIASALTDGKKVLTSYVDCLTYLPSSTDGKAITLATESNGKVNIYAANADEGQVIKSKRDLGDKYGMGDISSIGAEYSTQCASLDAYFTGKTLAESAAVDPENDEITGVTIAKDRIINVSKEAIAYSVKDVITDKPVSK